MGKHCMDDGQLLPFCYKNWNKRGLTWQQACKEAALVLYLAVKLDEVRKRDRQARKAKRRTAR